MKIAFGGEFFLRQIVQLSVGANIVSKNTPQLWIVLLVMPVDHVFSVFWIVDYNKWGFMGC